MLVWFIVSEQRVVLVHVPVNVVRRQSILALLLLNFCEHGLVAFLLVVEVPRAADLVYPCSRRGQRVPSLLEVVVPGNPSEYLGLLAYRAARLVRWCRGFCLHICTLTCADRG